ncbi:uncharacterized protein LOC106052246 isoform X1 [Biomphalaria glabrata]|uniref:Uncharacterized protein LOC106052246 isoform X1 n=1 Tax=Biomphalaria glabrata TaxID=6526 RepID=A0A9W3AB89_BIOGL|nr:uncharacterized protein LOC106052246 isoform X1 [Biomphalaria glabrata]XP_055884429.1 uncharacterized protein LOC106052246 isoform X1 [Biomphalaria glabrata]
MTARPLAVLDYVNYKTDKVLTKHARNRPLGAIEQRYNYIPAQPVLSCRTVSIDLSGTRTYRPKTSDEILDEQQRLVRRLYGKHIRPATSVSRPNTRLGASRPSTVRPQTESGTRHKVEVRGRPLTSLSTAYSPRESQAPSISPVRPKTKGSERYRNIQTATDSFLALQTDEDLWAKNINIRKINQDINCYWESGQNHLAQGIFMRGRRQPDDVPTPKLEAWLTFGGAAGAGGEGVIDAFTSFNTTQEYYNIDGTVGSKVARQLQKGDAIRIGINGDVTSRDLKIRRKSKKSLIDWNTDIGSKVLGNNLHVADEDFAELELKKLSDEDNYDDWQEFITLTDTLEENMDTNRSSVSLSSFPKKTSGVGQGQRSSSSVVPLSWADQCSKTDVKILKPKCVTQECTKAPSSETQPVKFEKLSDPNGALAIIQTPKNGFKIKQRSPRTTAPNSNSKLKVMYIDTLTQEEEEKIHRMSVDEIVNFKLGSVKKDSTVPSTLTSLKTGNQVEKNCATQAADHNSNNHKSERRSSRTSSVSSQSSNDHGHPSSPKLKTIPVHSSTTHPPVDLTIVTKSTPQNEMNKNGKVPGKLNPVKPIYRTNAAQGSSVKPGLQQGDAEYILITSQLKVGQEHAVTPSSSQTVAPFTPYVFSPGSNTPRDRSPSPLRDVHINPPGLKTIKPEVSVTGNNILPDSQQTAGIPVVEAHPHHHHINDRDNKVPDKVTSSPKDIESQSNNRTLNEASGPATLAINIPTADELSDRESPAPSLTDFDLSAHSERPSTSLV